jgi:hypothetical protein
MQGNLSLNLFFGTRDLRAAEATTDNHANSLGVRAHRLLHRLLHSAAERDALLQLFRDAAANQVGVQFRLANLDNVQTHALFGQRLQLGAQFINLRAAAANDNPRLGGVNCHRDLVCGRALNLDTRNCRIGKLLIDDIAQLEIFGKQIFVITLRVPARLPAFHDAEPETNGMYFMSQSVLLLSLASRVSTVV